MIKKIGHIFLLFVTLSAFAQVDKFAKRTKLILPSSYAAQSIQHIPLEMAQFYLALGVSEYWHCSKNDDPLSCSEYLQMMSDPISHLGFVFFMVASRSISEVGIKSKLNPQFAGYLGLASGMLVQTVFEEIYRHPDMQDFLRTRYIAEGEQRMKIRKESISRLYASTFGDKEWYAEKIPLISSLLLAAGFSPVLVKSAYKINSVSYRMLKKIIGAEKFQKMDSFFSKQGKSVAKLKRRISVKGIKVVFNKGKTTRFAPVIYLGEYLIGTITFLELHHIIDAQVSKYWREYRAKKGLTMALNNFKSSLQAPLLSEKEAIRHIKLVEEFWDNYRLALSETSFSLYARHTGHLDKMERSKEKVFKYYVWLARGADENDLEWIANENQWHAPSYDLLSFKSTIKKNIEQEKHYYINEMFCGAAIEDTIEFRVDYSGIPVPFAKVSLKEYRKLRDFLGNKLKLQSYDVNPYRAINFPGVCEKDLTTLKGKAIRVFSHEKSDISRYDMRSKYFCPISFDQGAFVLKKVKLIKRDCLKLQQQYREHLLKHEFDHRILLSKIYEDFSERVPNLLGLFKTQKIRRYEKALQAKIKTALGDQNSVPNFTQTLKTTILASYKNELHYWQSLSEDFPQLKKVILEVIKTTKKEQKAAQDLKDYIEQDMRTRDPGLFHGEFDFTEKTIWEDFWKGLILN